MHSSLRMRPMARPRLSSQCRSHHIRRNRRRSGRLCILHRLGILHSLCIRRSLWRLRSHNHRIPGQAARGC